MTLSWWVHLVASGIIIGGGIVGMGTLVPCFVALLAVSALRKRGQ